MGRAKGEASILRLLGTPKEMLSADAPGHGYWKGTRGRTLAQVSSGNSRLWPDLPSLIEYQLYLVEVEGELDVLRKCPKNESQHHSSGNDHEEEFDIFHACWDTPYISWKKLLPI